MPQVDAKCLFPARTMSVAHSQTHSFPLRCEPSLMAHPADGVGRWCRNKCGRHPAPTPPVVGPLSADNRLANAAARHGAVCSVDRQLRHWPPANKPFRNWLRSPATNGLARHSASARERQPKVNRPWPSGNVVGGVYVACKSQDPDWPLWPTPRDFWRRRPCRRAGTVTYLNSPLFTADVRFGGQLQRSGTYTGSSRRG